MEVAAGNAGLEPTRHNPTPCRLHQLGPSALFLLPSAHTPPNVYPYPYAQVATKQREQANTKTREVAAVLGTKGMARLRAAQARAEKGGKARTVGGAKKAGAGAGGAKAARPALRGPVRGAARFALMEERMQQRNTEKGKGKGKGPSGRKEGGGKGRGK